MKTKSRFASSFVAPWCVLIAIFAASASSASAQTLIAHYNLSPTNPTVGNLFTDSSPTTEQTPSLTLSSAGGGAIRSTTVLSPDPTATTAASAFFDGNGGRYVRNGTDFTGYTALTFDWHMMSTGTADGVHTVFGSGSSMNNAGSFRVNINPDQETLTVQHRMAAGVLAQSTYSVAGLDDWQHYTVTIDNSVVTTDGHLSLWVGGQLQTPTTATISGTVTGAAFGSSWFVVGRYADGLTGNFTGYLQDFKIYSGTLIPEPASIALFIGLAGAAMVFVVRRRR
ncbi:LamG-like jellyroll fold domain-containing protein [Geminisphaera colitermitum]|uniref:LamG-like jellyroll fold domain-containing protein n=1 Tax=Geminisphaera colitermitum TaxID=1148786 RepID=UPI000158E3B6|nr:PEP-CTERM sorting domain-containing protein [Geminisphaera colitermitum]